MTPQEFVAKLSVVVVDDNNATYRRLLLNTDARAALDPYWQRVLKLFAGLAAEQREVLLELTRQVTIDAAANVLGIIDGACELNGEHGSFRLTYEGRDLNGELQSLFLEQAEQAAP